MQAVRQRPAPSLWTLLINKAWTTTPLWMPVLLVTLWVVFFGIRVAMTANAMRFEYDMNMTKSRYCGDAEFHKDFGRECVDWRAALSEGLYTKAFWSTWEHSTVCGSRYCMDLLLGEWSFVSLVSRTGFFIVAAYVVYYFIALCRTAFVAYQQSVEKDQQAALRKLFRTPPVRPKRLDDTAEAEDF